MGPWELNYLDEAELITRTQNGDTGRLRLCCRWLLKHGFLETVTAFDRYPSV